MKVFGTELMYGATIEAYDMAEEKVYGFALIPVDEERSYLVNHFDNESNSVDSKAHIYYRCVSNETIKRIENPAKLYVEDEELEWTNAKPVILPYGSLEKEFLGINANGEEVLGIAGFKLDDENSIVLLDFKPNELADNRPGVSSYEFIKTSSLIVKDKGSNKKLIKES